MLDWFVNFDTQTTKNTEKDQGNTNYSQHFTGHSQHWQLRTSLLHAFSKYALPATYISTDVREDKCEAALRALQGHDGEQSNPSGL